MLQPASNSGQGQAPPNPVAVKVLIAEDNLVDRKIITTVVKKFGYEVVTALDGLEAWNCLQAPGAPQIALFDWMMPGLDGPELCRRLRARERPQALYTLLVTGKSDREDIVAGLEAGADDFISKPWNPAELRARINVGCRMVQLQNRLQENVAELRGSLADTRRLIEEQNLNIDQASRLLRMANAGTPHWIGLDDELTLHIAFQSQSRERVGGDHFWARTLPAQGSRGPVTTIGIRDQSGHDINCILRSIASDLVHMDALKECAALEEQIARVNERLCFSGMFGEDDFLTALTLELEHASLRLRYVSCGHPPMLLIRGSTVLPLPDESEAGRNIPLGSLPRQSFKAGECDLRPRDRILLYTDGLGEINQASRGHRLSNKEILEIVQSILKEEPGIPVCHLVKRLLQDAAGGPGHANKPAQLGDDVTVIGLEIEEDGTGDETVFHLANAAEIDNAVRHLCENILRAWNAEPAALRLRQFLDEAITNSWLHGNKQNSRLPIRIRWSRHNGCALQIEDAGSGFSLNQIIDPCSPEGLLRENGRGVFIIKSICEWVQWKKAGTRLAARLAIPSQNA